MKAAVGDMFRCLGIAEVHAESLTRSVTVLGAHMKKIIVIVGKQYLAQYHGHGVGL